jgi:nucleoside 2-deoxyribosyltransferase
MNAPQALILSPMDLSYRQIRDTVRRVLTESGVRTIQIDESFQSGTEWRLANAVTDAIQEADFIVADVSMKDPNVLYELGYAHALRKPTLLMLSIDSKEEMPSDLAGYQMLTYNPRDIYSIESQIIRFLKYQASRWGSKNG